MALATNNTAPPPPPAVPASASGASLSDILTSIKNLVTTLGTASNNFLNVHGQTTVCNITAATLIKSSAGRVAQVSVISGGSAPGAIFDVVSLTGARTKQLYVIPDTVGTAPYIVNMPASFGILVVPGTGQIVSVSFS
jgi:hypothetical protein